MPAEPLDNRTDAFRPGAPNPAERRPYSEEPEETPRVFRADTNTDQEAANPFRYAVYEEEIGPLPLDHPHQRKS
jgi:hypothetical protein